MRVSISGHQMEMSEALQGHADDKLQSLQAHVEGLKDAHVVFSQLAHHHNLHHAAVTAHAGGLILHAEGSGIDAYAGLDDAVAKLHRQLEKYKGRLAKHRERRKKFKEKLKDLGPLSFESMSVSDAHLDEAPDDMFADGQYHDLAPAVVRKVVDKIAPMTVDEAVMQMDLLHKPAFLFLNVSSGKLNMVYREGEAQVRWVVPQ